MGKGRFGSLFEEILSKSPDMADKLKNMAKRNGDTPSKEATPEKARPEDAEAKKPSTKKPPIDRMANVVVEKKSITPRVRAKPAKPKPISKPAKKQKRVKAKHTISGSSNKATPSYPDRFFHGIPENAHQFGLNDGSQILDVVIGLDFGTSSTKVVVHAPNYAGNPAFAIPFGQFAHDSLDYLLPTRLAVNSNGSCSLSPETGAAILTDIKITLIRSPHGSVEVIGETPCAATPMTVTTAYLALVLRYVRGWFLAHKKSIFQDFKINWAVNLGLPAAIDDDPKLRETFDLAGKAAWLISRKPGPVTLNDAYRAIEDIKHSRFKEDDLPWDFELVPEVIAEVTGYARSEFRSEGLHFLVDVGASTLDVCAFALRDNEGDDHFTIYTAEVVLLGAQRLHQARIDGAQKATSESAAQLFDARDPLSLIPNDLTAYVPDGQLVVEGVDRANKAFAKDSSNAVHKTIWHTRKKRDPNSPRWSENLPIFVCGGARAIDLYEQAIQGVETWVHRFIPSCPGIRVIPLPKPTSLEANIDDADYHRLAVAWGLSHESFNIGTYDRPSEIDDIPPPRKVDISDRFIGAEMT